MKSSMKLPDLDMIEIRDQSEQDVMIQKKQNQKKQREKRRRKKKRIVFLIRFLLWLILLAAIAGMGNIYCNVHYNLTGTWEKKIDLTDEVNTNIALWLSDIAGYETDPLWVKSKTEGLQINLALEMQQTSFFKGNYQLTIEQASYEAMEQEAQKWLADCMEEIIAERLKEAGYDLEVSKEQAEDAITKVLGCSMEEYLKETGVSMIPSLEDLKTTYEIQGYYSMDLHTITWSNERDGNKQEAYEKGKETLIFPEQDLIFRKQVVE